jgi:hypothetical protein
LFDPRHQGRVWAVVSYGILGFVLQCQEINCELVNQIFNSERKSYDLLFLENISTLEQDARRSSQNLHIYHRRSLWLSGFLRRRIDRWSDRQILLRNNLQHPHTILRVKPWVFNSMETSSLVN